MFSCPNPTPQIATQGQASLRLPPRGGQGKPLHRRANPMAIHGLWLGQGKHVGTYDCSFSRRSGHAVVGWWLGGQHSSVCICSGLPTKIKASLFHRLLWTAASNDSGPASQHTFVCAFVLWHGTWREIGTWIVVGTCREMQRSEQPLRPASLTSPHAAFPFLSSLVSPPKLHFRL